MTKNERMIWAAAYVKHFDLKNPPSRCLSGPNSVEEWCKWEDQQCVSAMENAANAVGRARRNRAEFLEGWEGCDCADMVAQMIPEVDDGGHEEGG